jgi:hypothetical protein
METVTYKQPDTALIGNYKTEKWDKTEKWESKNTFGDNREDSNGRVIAIMK